jgi:hypothetical protein
VITSFVFMVARTVGATLRNVDLEHAVSEPRTDLVAVTFAGELERAAEASHRALEPDGSSAGV